MRLTRRHRAGLLLMCAIIIAFAAAILPPFPQPLAYHRFADARAWLGVPNFLDVVSNLAFLMVAALGLAVVLLPDPHSNSTSKVKQGGGERTTKTVHCSAVGARRAVPVREDANAVSPMKWNWNRAFIERAERLPYALFFLALGATSFGSTWYHLAPDNASLFWDRLPMSVCYAALLAAVIAERYSVQAGIRLLAPLTVAGAATVFYWRWSEAASVGNLLPYFAFQVYAILAVLLLMRLFPPRYTCSADLFKAVALYGAALAAELLDHPIYALGQIVSGHTLKHLLAALAVYQVVRMLRLRTGVRDQKKINGV